MTFTTADLDRWAARYERFVDVPIAERVAAHHAAMAAFKQKLCTVKKESLS